MRICILETYGSGSACCIVIVITFVSENILIVMNIIIINPLYIIIMVDTVTDTTSCRTAASAVSEIENIDHL